MANYVCTVLGNKNILTGEIPCKMWIDYVPPANVSSVFDQLNNLSQADATLLLTKTVLLFAMAWGWNFLGRFASR